MIKNSVFVFLLSLAVSVAAQSQGTMHSDTLGFHFELKGFDSIVFVSPCRQCLAR